MDRILIILKKENGPRASSAPALGLNTIIFKYVYWYMKQISGERLQDHCPLVFIAPAYSRVRYRSPNFCPSVRSFVRPSTFTSKFGFLDIRDSCESETLHSNCP